MIRFFKKIFQNITVFCIAVVFSFCLFMMFLNPLHPVFFLGERLSAATNGVSNYASVPVNPMNKLALQLDQKQKELEDKERFLDDRALAMERDNSVWRNRLLLGVLAALVALFILVSVNFYFDSRRSKELERLEAKK
jgi:hypothetical protein